MSLFENTMIIHFGDGESEAEYAMYDIRGTSPRDTRAVEVEAPQAQYLNSMCCFVLTTPDRAYVWYGTGSNPLFRSMADHVCARLRGNKEVLTIKEVNFFRSYFTYIINLKFNNKKYFRARNHLNFGATLVARRPMLQQST